MSDGVLYKTLYKLNTNGSIQVWHLYRNVDSYWSVSGKLNGKLTTNEPTYCEPKQKRTQDEQVISVCESQIEKKRRKKYVENLDDVHNANDNLLGFEAMLAHKYDAKNKKKISFPCMVQPKLDGIRNLATKDGFFSRGRKEFESCLHIKAELRTLFEDYPDARLDGEFYTHEFKEDFEQICKAVKKTASKASDKDLMLQNKIQYWIYDAPRIVDWNENHAFEVRQNAIACIFMNYRYIRVVPTMVAYSEADILEWKERWIQEGFEGIMIRQMNAGYEAKRSFTLLKLKDFIDEEFEIIAINEGQGKLAGHAGSFTFLNKKGKNFEAKMIGSIGRLKRIFENQEDVLGKMATVRYQNLSAESVPRFPVCRGIRDYE